MDKDEMSRSQGSTFLIKVYFRQNNTWQGRIEWLEIGKSLSFRSLLEMLRLMQEASETSTFPVETNFRQWIDKEDVS